MSLNIVLCTTSTVQQLTLVQGSTWHCLCLWAVEYTGISHNSVEYKNGQSIYTKLHCTVVTFIQMFWQFIVLLIFSSDRAFAKGVCKVVCLLTCLHLSAKAHLNTQQLQTVISFALSQDHVHFYKPVFLWATEVEIVIRSSELIFKSSKDLSL